MRILRSISAAGLCLALFQSVLLSGPVPAGKPAHYPDWWFDRDVIPRLPAAAAKTSPSWPADYPTADDYAVANIGQLKAIANQAAIALDYAYPDGISDLLRGIIVKWTAPVPAIPSIQQGLLGTYYGNVALSGTPALSRREAIDFDWGYGAPAGTLPSDQYSARWTGYFVAPVSGSYVLQTNSDDGVRLWLGHEKLIDDWTDHGASTRETPALELVAGKKYAIKLEYYENGSGAVIQLKWKQPESSGFTIIPFSQLYSTDTYGYDDLIAYLAYLEEPARDDFAALNQGQLKHIADLFYQRLAELDYHGAPLATGQTRPWTVNTPSDDEDYALVNLGQLKRVFSFSLSPKSIPDIDADGLSDAEETAFGSTASPGNDFDHDGYTDVVDAFPADPAKHTYTGALSVTLFAPTGAIPLP